MVERRQEYRFEANNQQDTERLAALLADTATAGTVIALDGDLGAGKTTFSQAFARAIGVEGVVNSPTFTIIKEYAGRELSFYHMDVYRISLEEAEDLGLDDYFYGDGATLIEWASVIEEILPPERLGIYIQYTGEQSRTFVLRPYGVLYEDWCRGLREKGELREA